MKSFYRRLFKTLTLLFLIFTTFNLAFHHCRFHAYGSDKTYSAIEEADKSLRQAFVAVLDAERAGANVSNLTGRLNEAAQILAEAETAYRAGNFSEALTKAEQCSTMVNDIIDEASSVKDSAMADAQRVLFQTLTSSLAWSASFLAVLFYFWEWFRRVYAKKLLRMKPEVASDVEA